MWVIHSFMHSLIHSMLLLTNGSPTRSEHRVVMATAAPAGGAARWEQWRRPLPLGARSSVETGELLRAAVARAGRIRGDLAQLREEAFVAASCAPAAAAAAAGPPTDPYSLQMALPPTAGGGDHAPMMLPVMLMQQHSAPQFKVMPAVALGTPVHSGSGSGGFHPLLGAAGDSPGLPTGECRAAPKSSGTHQEEQLASQSSWSIPSGRSGRLQGQQQAAPPLRLASAADPDQPALLSPSADGGSRAAAVQHPDAARRSSFEDIIAALRAEASMQPDSQPGAAEELLLAGAAMHGSNSAALSYACSAAATRSSDRRGQRLEWAGRSTQQPQQRRSAARSQQHQQPLPTFDPSEVNAAKRYNEARMRAGGGPAAAPRSSAVPRLPLALLSRAGSGASSLQGSARLSGRENVHGQGEAIAAWAQQQQQRSTECGAMPSSSGAACGSARPAADEACGLNFLPLARDERSPLRSNATDGSSRLAAAVGGESASAASGASSLRSGQKESRVSLAALLAASPAASTRAAAAASNGSSSAAAAPSHSLPGPPQAAFSMGGAASEAPAAASSASSRKEGQQQRQAPTGSTPSIGRKRSGSEVGLSHEEEPASVKKRSPEVVSSSHRLLPCTGKPALAVAPDLARAQQAGMGATVAELFSDEQQQLQQQPQAVAEPPALPAVLLPVAAVVPAPAAAQPSRSTASQRSRGSAAQATSSNGYSSGRLVMPVVMQHSPMKQRRQQPAGEPPAPEPAAAAQPAPDRPMQQADVPAVAPPLRQRPPRPDAKPATAQPQQLQRQQPTEQARQHQQPGPLPQAKQQHGADVRTAAEVAADGGVQMVEKELPSESFWVARPKETTQQAQQAQHAKQQQVQHAQHVKQQAPQPSPQQPDPTSTSVLVGGAAVGSGSEQPRQPAAPQVAASAVLQPALAPEPQLPTAQSPPPPTNAAAAAAATPAATPRVAITPRRRMTSLEPPESGLRLRDDVHGKELLGCAPELVGMTGVALLDVMRQGCVVRKAWVKPNFKQGGSVRCVQLAPGGGGKAELLYPSGMFRKPLRVAVKRGVVNSPAWRIGAYLVLDTARGMLRLEPSTAAEYARWVLALNAAFVASGAAGGGEGGGSGGIMGPVGDMPWSPAILFG
ncbi:hypothetical protein CHLNCDRAFT_54039 [Chlorella variabilis]|uniref:PH domain-containing protein n=1 Tax=Chlorella variabilis TaxID=554065 RepID=E1ZM85_CHLVA|nr:hypothetical protein CHLNCDRAFT_54039 [Chlorella variabilis]EFN53064.1 hypothetical protein CHLNCDRAFT_54039 [Chlorella variabilis]|eukprot:XP_005845166.1 hypothetical protein CHLNCDRAFT_54039 [Chlorella variabilis]